ncbi:hypothetical protein [Lutibacter flavus]|uniref:Uncharacterized protein n=1 Tax=Lutibacter flavus TaxID=691689 RepID=A0A238VHE1_9FLAO|nr:hypothetical protein [Lutibacter flavus]SNR33815.1 hypothetical protein SAMN04488111_0511 [Lutibacter flavus]
MKEFKKNEEVEIIKFLDYVGNDENANAVLTDFSYHKFIDKNTGVGITTAAYNYKGGNLIIISPNIVQITDKIDGKYYSDKQLGIYGETKDLWQEAMDYFGFVEIEKQNLIINCTPNQITWLYQNRKDIFGEIIQIPVLVDEIHAFTQDAVFRVEMGFCMELVYKKWEAKMTLTTATPIYGGHDIPKELDIKYYKFQRYDEPTKSLRYSTKKDDAFDFVYNENNNKNKVAVFTNNIRYHKSFSDLKTKSGTGDALRVKLAPFNGDTSREKLSFDDCDIIVFSSSYFAGFDINQDCSVCIISEQNNDAYKININNLVQSYGRCRKTVQNALYVNITSPQNGSENCTQISEEDVITSFTMFKDDFTYFSSVVGKYSAYYQVSHHKSITQSMDVNRAFLFNNALNTMNDYQQYNKGIFIERMKEYNFKVSDYVTTNTAVSKKKSTVFSERLLNLMDIDKPQLLKDYNKIKNNIKNKSNGKGVFSSKDALEYLSAYFLKVTNTSQLVEKLRTSKRVKRKDIYASMNLLLRVNTDTKYYTEQLSEEAKKNAIRLYANNDIREILEENTDLTNDWQFLYNIHQITYEKLSVEYEREIKILIEANNEELYKKYESNPQRYRDVLRVISSRVDEIFEPLSTTEIELIKDIVKKLFKRIDKGKSLYFVTFKSLRDKMVNNNLFLLTEGQANHRTILKKNREYNAMTQLSKVFRKAIPLRYLSIDLTSAHPQIIDQILGTKIGMQVYDNLMENMGISRAEAKRFFNMTLNNYKFTVAQAQKIYLDSGYDKDNALKLAKMTAKVPKGSFYVKMTMHEKRIIEKYRRILPVTCHRFHDALIVSEEAILESNIVLPTQVDEFFYHVELYNDGSEYMGPTTDTPHSSKNTIDNYQFY